MQGYLDEYSNLINLPIKELINDYRVIFLGGKLIEIINYIKILNYSTEKVVLKLKNSNIEINGLNLQIKELSKKDIVISGKIKFINLFED